MFVFFIFLVLAAGHSIVRYDTLISRDISLPQLDVRDTDLLQTILVPRMMPKPQEQETKPLRDSSTSPPRGRRIPITGSLDLDSGPQIPMNVAVKEAARKGPSAGNPVLLAIDKATSSSSTVSKPYTAIKKSQRSHDLLESTKQDPYYPMAKHFQKELHLDKHMTEREMQEDRKNIVDAYNWMRGVRDRVAEAKSKAISGQKPFQPMALDKAKSNAKKARAKADQEYQKLAEWKAPPKFDLGLDSPGTEAHAARDKDNRANVEYRRQLGIAKNRAKHDNRWNDVVRHEESAAMQNVRENLRAHKMNRLVYKQKEAYWQMGMDRKNVFSQDQGAVEGRLKVSGVLYQQARKLLTSSDSEEELPPSVPPPP